MAPLNALRMLLVAGLAAMRPTATPTPAPLKGERLASFKTLAHRLDRLAWRASNTAREPGDAQRLSPEAVSGITSFEQRALALHERLDIGEIWAQAVNSEVASLRQTAATIDKRLRADRASDALRRCWRSVTELLGDLARAARGARPKARAGTAVLDAHKAQAEHHESFYHLPFAIRLDVTSLTELRCASHELAERLDRVLELADDLRPGDDEGARVLVDLHHFVEEGARLHPAGEAEVPDPALLGLLIRHMADDGRLLDRQLAQHDLRAALEREWPRVMVLLDQLEKLLR
jgi:hypothetical protein